jgi:hypothetical protein
MSKNAGAMFMMKKREHGRQAQHKKIAEGVPGETVGELGGKGTRAFAQDIAKGGLGGQEDRCRAGGGGNRSQRAAKQPAEQEPREDRQDGRRRKGKGDSQVHRARRSRWRNQSG